MTHRDTVPPELETVADWLRWSATQLARADLYFGHGTDSAWDDAVALVSGLLRLPEDRLQVLLNARLTRHERQTLADALERRIGEHVPVPYITGLAWYGGLQFEVDPRVLIPRSPIQELLLAGLQPWLGERHPRRILDLCTGSGCIGIVAAHVFPDAEVVLADLSADALMVARRNVRRHGLEDRVQVVESDLCASLQGEPFDLVLCNPPYVDAHDLATMPAEFDHEPALALDGGADGLVLVHRLLERLPRWLAANGLLVLEVGNSAPALLSATPGLEWVWPELEQGGVGVALLEGRSLHAGASPVRFDPTAG